MCGISFCAVLILPVIAYIDQNYNLKEFASLLKRFSILICSAFCFISSLIFMYKYRKLMTHKTKQTVLAIGIIIACMIALILSVGVGPEVNTNCINNL
jgi:uncharacterized BrkB/YihY/UPF0761 family membrane protein